MVKYSCENCQSVFAQKGHLEAHKNRKRPCKKDNTIEALVEKKVQEVLSKTNEGAVKNEATTTTIMQSNQMDYSTKTREELIALCKEKKIKGYSGKKKEDIAKLLTHSQPKNEIVVLPPKVEEKKEETPKTISLASLWGEPAPAPVKTEVPTYTIIPELQQELDDSKKKKYMTKDTEGHQQVKDRT